MWLFWLFLRGQKTKNHLDVWEHFESIYTIIYPYFCVIKLRNLSLQRCAADFSYESDQASRQKKTIQMQAILLHKFMQNKLGILLPITACNLRQVSQPLIQAQFLFLVCAIICGKICFDFVPWNLFFRHVYWIKISRFSCRFEILSACRKGAELD